MYAQHQTRARNTHTHTHANTLEHAHITVQVHAPAFVMEELTMCWVCVYVYNKMLLERQRLWEMRSGSVQRAEGETSSLRLVKQRCKYTLVGLDSINTGSKVNLREGNDVGGAFEDLFRPLYVTFDPALPVVERGAGREGVRFCVTLFDHDRL